MFTRISNKGILFVLPLMLCLEQPAFAANKGLAAQFGWQAEWGNIRPDTKIPSSQHGAKKDINNAVDLRGTGDTSYGKIGT
jgi:hypothetical protein